jgi:hypothetical protein
VTSTTYATVADFVKEAEAIGRVRSDTWESETSGDCTFSTAKEVNTYDDQRRPIHRHYETTGVDPAHSFGPFQIETTFTAWEALGRPTQETATHTGAGAGCGTSNATLTYDDVARTVVWRGDDCGSQVNQTDTYDADGNLVKWIWTSETASDSSVTTINATAMICL